MLLGQRSPGRRNPLSRCELARRPPLGQELLDLVAAQVGPAPSLKLLAVQTQLIAEVMRFRRLTGSA